MTRRTTLPSVSHTAVFGETKRVAEPPEVTFQGEWRYTGGTGRFKGITGNGTYKGELTAAGLTYEYQGAYEVKQ